jgi:hypothetical protein
MLHCENRLVLIFLQLLQFMLQTAVRSCPNRDEFLLQLKNLSRGAEIWASGLINGVSLVVILLDFMVNI